MVQPVRKEHPAISVGDIITLAGVHARRLNANDEPPDLRSPRSTVLQPLANEKFRANLSSAWSTSRGEGYKGPSAAFLAGSIHSTSHSPASSTAT
ncbi:hypothetical protein AcV7_006919 [Taiwanofungus camphoratus]|nr:hypothetical protein AcV7_006919 [Antrodia cinnamomea]